MRRDSANETGADEHRRWHSTEGRRPAACRGDSTASSPAHSGVAVERLRGRECQRGQTTLDFAVGITIFLLTLAFSFAFVPGMLAPFTEGTQEQKVTVNRVADALSQDLLTHPTQPYVLDTHCTVEFFDDNSPSECRFSGATLHERVRVHARQSLNVTIRGDVSGGESPDVLCWERSGNELIEQENGCGDVQLTAGSSVTSHTGGSVTARRNVVLAGENVTMEVHAW